MAKCVVVLRKYIPISIRSCARINTPTWPIFSRSGHELNCRSTVSYCTANIFLEDDTTPKKKVSKAMRAYLERAKAHDEFMKEQVIQYKIGKRHLANMMGEDPETFTQDDVNKAIEYLFPSGLFEPRARPLMKPPDEVFPARKAAEFDESGRPHHFLFYTGRPHLYQLYYDIVDHFNSLNDFEDKMLRKHLKPDTTQKLIMSGSTWVTKPELEKILVEPLSDREFFKFVTLMDRLLEHPYSYRLKEFIEKFRKPMLSQTSASEIPKPQYDADGRAYVTTKGCPRKSARADVTVRSPGTGKITINGQPLEYFENIQDREQLLFPLIFTNAVGTVDVEATVTSGGPTGQAGAVRLGIALGLRCFLSQDVVERMRIAGLLQRDFRRRERKKPGQAGARRKYTWKKR